MKLPERVKRQPAGLWIGAGLFAAALLAVLLLTNCITLYCDDYWYGTFFRDGWSGFWELTVWHYLNFNGRAFVHFCAEVALVFDRYLFVLLNPLMLAVVFLLSGRMQSRETPWRLLLPAAGAGIMAVLALPVSYLNTSILWISAAFNYLFPLCVLLPALWCFRRDTQTGRLRPWTVVLALLAGATTEQNGLAAVVCLGGWGFLAWLRKKLPFWKMLLIGGLAAAGYLTVIFAPGTWIRVGRETGGFLDLLQPAVLLARLRASVVYFTDSAAPAALFTAFALLSALHVLLTRRSDRILLLGFAAAPAYLLLRWGRHFAVASAFAVAYLIFTAVVYLLREETTVRGLLLAGMLATQLVLVAAFSEYRTTIPAILLLFSVCASLLAECLERLPVWSGAALPAVIAAALLTLALPTFRGYAANAAVWRQNEAALRSEGDGLITLDLDLDLNYRYFLLFDSASYFNNAKEYYRMPERPIAYRNAEGTVAGLWGGDRAGLPVVIQNDTVYFPLQSALWLLGGDSGWSYAVPGTWAELNGTCYLFRPNGESFAWDNEREERLSESFQTGVIKPWYTYYVPAGTMAELFGITWTYNEAENIYYIQAG